MNAFIDFLREQGVVGLAIGFILGGATSKLVASFVADVVQPSIGWLIGSTEGLKAWQLGPILLGNFTVAFIDFVIIAAVVFFVFKFLRLEKLDKKKS